MIITENFVYIHMPKTGGTFVTTVLEQLYNRGADAPKGRGARAGAGGYLKLWGPEMKHAWASKIPEEHRPLPVVGCVRNPYDRYVSEYYFQWWRRHPEQYVGLAQHHSYPDLTFAEFCEYLNDRRQRILRDEGIEPDPTIGRETYQFIYYYAKDPQAFLKCHERGSLSAEAVRRELVTDQFLRTHRLNDDLYRFLCDAGVPDERCAFILKTPVIRPPRSSRTDEQSWEAEYTPELKEYVRHRERILFDLFPEFDV